MEIWNEFRMEKQGDMIDFNFSRKKDNKNTAKKNIYRYNRYVEYYMQIMEYFFSFYLWLCRYKVNIRYVKLYPYELYKVQVE